MVSSVSGTSSSTSNITNSLRITGLASGMDTEQMVSDLMKAARIPRDQVFQKQQWAEWQQGAYRDINLAMQTFRTAEQNLRFESSFNPYSATVSDPTAATATLGSNVLQGTYTIDVTTKASAATLISGSAVVNSSNTNVKSTDTYGTTGSIVIQGPTPAGGTAPAPITINVASGDSFGTIASNITTACAGIGLKASFDDTTSRFVLTSTSTGDLGNYTISDGAGSTIANTIVNGGNQTISSGGYSFHGTNADINITPPGSSTPIHITQATNSISTLGLNLTLQKSSGSFTVEVKTDTDAVYNNIKGFVDAYNTVIDTINTKLTEKRYRDYPPLTDDQRSSMSDSQITLWEQKAKSGLLSQDPTLQDIADSLRSAINSPVTSISGNNKKTLSSIGIGTEFVKSNGLLVTDSSNSGKLQIDETTLRDAIANDPNGVMNLFTAVDPNANYTVYPPKVDTNAEGIGSRLYDIVGNSISKLNNRAGDPSWSVVDTSALGQQIKDLTDQISQWDDRLSALQDRYNQEFTAMETAINKFNSQASYLSQANG